MKTIEVKLYEFNELSINSKKSAIENVKKLTPKNDWKKDAILSLKAFVSALEENDSVHSLTDYCADNILTDTWNKTKSLDKAINDWIKQCAKDYEYQISDEAIAESIVADEYEFTENGNRYDHI